MQESTIQTKKIEISLVELIKILWRSKVLIVSIVFVFSIIGVVYALSLPNKYNAEVLVIPSEDSGGAGLSALANQFGGLAGMAGINLSGGASKKAKIALQLLKSKDFIIEFINKNQLQVDIFAAEGWDIKENKLLINPELYDVKTKKWVRKFKFPKTLAPSNLELFDTFNKMLNADLNHREGTYSISIEYFNPHLAAKWANMLVIAINNKMRQIDISQAEDSIKFLNVQIENNQLSSTDSVFYGLIEEQTKKAMLAQVQTDYVFTVIDPALAPEKRSQPKKALICILFAIFGSIVATFIVLARHYTKK